MVTITNWKESVKDDNMYCALFFAELCGFTCKEIRYYENDYYAFEFNGMMDNDDVQMFLYNFLGGAESEEEYQKIWRDVYPNIGFDYNWIDGKSTVVYA